MSAPKVLIYVQHLLGVGHLKRMALLADALAAAGASVTLASGGMPAPQILVDSSVRFVQLPPLQAADAQFSGLVNASGTVADADIKNQRTALLLDLLDQTAPDILVVELFPLGRRQMRFELLPLLDSARPKVTRIACSVRDIVNQRPHREAEALGWLNDYFDMLLVHGDEGLTPIRNSVPGIDVFRGTVHHTGYIAESKPATRAPARSRDIIVSAGGGAAGTGLFAAAARASAAIGDDWHWRFRHGRDTPQDLIDEWRASATVNATFEAVAPDFPDLLEGAALSISQFGYNTAVSLLQASAPAIVVPFEGAGETEQLRRALAWRQTGLAVVRENELGSGQLEPAARAQLSTPHPMRGVISCDGLTNAVSLLLADWNPV